MIQKSCDRSGCSVATAQSDVRASAFRLLVNKKVYVIMRSEERRSFCRGESQPFGESARAPHLILEFTVKLSNFSGGRTVPLSDSRVAVVQNKV